MKLEELFEAVKKSSREMFEDHGTCQPVFVTIEPPMIIPCAFRDNNDKRMQLAMIRAIFKERNVQMYGLAFEAWVATEKYERVADLRDLTPPSERADRKECILVCAEDKSRTIGGLWNIERDRTGRAKITTFMDVPDANNDVGAFRNMLGKERLVH